MRTSQSPITSQAPLEGVRVLDLTRLLPGPMASLHLADLGADVIKIEAPVDGDYARWMGPLKKTQSGWFLALNRNKRSVVLDLKSSTGKQAFLDLVASSDAVLEGFRPGVMQRLGLSFAELSDINPKVVLCSISGYGQSGPYRDKAGHDINYCALTGVLEQSGSRGAPPAPGNFQLADLAGGTLSAVMGILAALYSVARGGRGRHVDVAMADCVGAHAVMPLAELQAHGSTAPRGDGFLSGQLPNYGVYRTKDDHFIAVGALEAQFWARLCIAIGAEELRDVTLDDADECRRARQKTATIFASQTRDFWCEKLTDVDCCAGPVLTLAEAMQDAHMVSRGLYFTADHPLEGSVTQCACPIKMSDYEFRLRRHAPMLGEHNEEVFRALGYNAEKINALSSFPATPNR